MNSFLRTFCFSFVWIFILKANIILTYADDSYVLEWPAELQLIDEEWKLSGYDNWKIIEESSWAYVWAFWNQIYVSNRENYKIKVIWKEYWKYRLFLSNGDYFTQISNVSTVEWQVDTYTRTNDSITIDFSDFKFGYYNLLIDNFWWKSVKSINQVYLPAIWLTQRFKIDWNKVSENNPESIEYSIGSLSFSLAANGSWEVLGFFFGILSALGICLIVFIFIMRKPIYTLIKKLFFKIKNFSTKFSQLR